MPVGARSGAPEGFPSSVYESRSDRSTKVYRISTMESEADIYVYRSGKLARFGHNHIITSRDIFGYIMLVNSFLTVVELLPIPGRDGGRILVRFLSPRAAMKFEELVQYELIFLLVLFLFLESVVVHMTDSFRSLIGAA